jgi:RNA polymerase sigma factor (sigma-70 family)
MIEQCADLDLRARQAAEDAIQRCARNLLTVDFVAARVIEEWNAQAREGEQPSQTFLNRLALRYCSRSLYHSCCSTDPVERDTAFDNLYHYMKFVLECSPYARSLAEKGGAIDDVLQQKLAELCRLFSKQPPGGPDDPAAFLQWAKITILHSAWAFLEQEKKHSSLSLEAQSEEYVEQNAICERHELVDAISDKELQEALKHAILSLKNQRYRHVLIALFLAGMEESELAASMDVQVKDIYLWRHRALRALRGNREVVEALQDRLR